MRRVLLLLFVGLAVSSSAGPAADRRQPALTKAQAEMLARVKSSTAIAAGMWISTARQTDADELQFQQQVAGDAAVFGWYSGRTGIVLTEPGTYLIQTRVPVYGTPGQAQLPYVNVSITDYHQPQGQVSQVALAGQAGYSELRHLLLYVKAAGDYEPYEVLLGFGADPQGYTEGAVLVIEKLQ